MVSPYAQAIVAHVMLTGNPTDGVTQKDIQDALGLSQASVSRVIRSTPGFKQSIRPVFPKGYWFDVTMVTPKAEPKQPKRATKPTGNSPKESSESVTQVTPVISSQVEALCAILKNQSSEGLREAILNEVIPALHKVVDDDVSLAGRYHQLANMLTALGLEIERRWV